MWEFESPRGHHISTADGREVHAEKLKPKLLLRSILEIPDIDKRRENSNHRHYAKQKLP
jgi:hypothetical protein